MTDDLLALAAAVALAVAAFVAFALALQHASTPAVCRAAEIALENPGTELVVYGRVWAWNDSRYVYLSCGLRAPLSRVLAINKTAGELVVGSTADGRLYIK